MGIVLNDLNKTFVVDFNFIEPTTSIVGAYNKAGQAAHIAKAEKLKQYKHWEVKNHPRNHLKILSFETFGIFLADDIKDFFKPLIHQFEDQYKVMSLIYQQLSVAMHTMRAKQFFSIKDRLTVDLRPLQPVLNSQSRLLESILNS
jgi:hypothetical protein